MSGRMTNLLETSEDVVTYLNFYIYELENSPDPVQKGKYAMAVSNYYEAVAICELLLDAEVDTFFHHLIRSAQTRKWLLEQSKRDKGYSPQALKASYIKPFFDAIVANQFNLAIEIARLSPKTCYPNVEYEDDFYYAHFLYKYLMKEHEDELIEILNKFYKVLEGMESARFKLCWTLLKKVTEGCKEAFNDLLSERELRIEKIRKHSSYGDGSDALFFPNSVVYLEGLAWLRLLDRAGAKMDYEYKYCPEIAKTTTYAPFKVTTFPGIPL